MPLRELLEKNGKFVVPVLIVAAILAISLGLSSESPSSSVLTRDKWMFDLNTGELVRSSVGTVAPSDQGAGGFEFGQLGSAGSLVDAVLYTCGDPSQVRDGMNADELASIDAHIIYLAMNDFRAAAPSPDEDEGPGVTRLVSAVDGARWVPEYSKAGQAIQSRVETLCGDKLPRQSLP